MATYCCADLHGRLDIYKSICAFLKPEDKVYFLGDASDRGNDSWELVKAIYENSQWIYIKGNHEQMLIDAAREYNDKENHIKYSNKNYRLLKLNGGAQTFEDWRTDPDRELWINRLKKLPCQLPYTNARNETLILSHAGYTYWDRPITEHDLLWSRDHFYDPWDGAFPSIIMVHGHTPNSHLAARLNINYDSNHPYPIWYGDNHKICLDNGAVFSGRALLMDLDSYEFRVFEAI